jgi:cytochrome bd ubiquinol oxidase subunit I
MVEELPRYWEQLTLLRKIIIAESWAIHILMATFLLGAATIAPLSELLGMIFKQPYYERFARGMALINVVVYSVGAVLAIAAVFVTLGFYPKFFTTFFLQFFWFLIGEEITFMGQLYIVLLYYFMWDKLSGRAKPLHVILGLTWLPMAILQMSQIISFMGFALTPEPEVPFFNPGFIPQVSHRVMGNLSWAGFVIATVAGIQYMRHARTDNRRETAFWDWVGSMGAVFGLVAMVFFMAFSGYSWVIGAKGTSPSAFYKMMVGELAWMFQLQTFFFGLLIVVTSYYMLRRLRQAGKSTRLMSLVTILLVFFWLLGSIPYYIGPGAEQMWVPWTIPLGAMRPWKYIALGGLSLFGLVAVLAYLQGARDGLNWGGAGHTAQRVLITAGFLVLSVMYLMGVIRETARLPGQIYGQMDYYGRIIPEYIYPHEDVHRPKLGPFRGP